MLISHKHKFIFVHVFKNAGTSIETTLLPHATFGPLHYYAYRALRQIPRKINEALLLIGRKRIKLSNVAPLPLPWNPQPLRDHATALQIAEKIGRETFDSYFSFSVARNPWDWHVSRYKFFQILKRHAAHERAQSSKDFTEFLLGDLSAEKPPHLQKNMFCSENGGQLVNFICRFENLQADFAEACAKIGIQAELPHLNRTSHRPYQEYYVPETIELVRRRSAPDIEMFGYEFDAPV